MSKVTRKYQITIPINVRKSLGIIPGSEVDIVSKGDNFVLRAKDRVKNNLAFSHPIFRPSLIDLHSLNPQRS